MITTVPEYDTESYTRKWQNTFAVHLDNKALKYGRIVDINTKTMRVKYGQGMEEVPLPTNPVYWRFPARLYRTKTNWYLLLKRVRKSFHIGMSLQTHVLLRYDRTEDTWVEAEQPNFYNIDVFKPLKINIQQAIKTYGAISDRFFLSRSRLYYLDNVVGLRENNRIFLMAPELEPDLKQILKNVKCELLIE